VDGIFCCCDRRGSLEVNQYPTTIAWQSGKHAETYLGFFGSANPQTGLEVRLVPAKKKAPAKKKPAKKAAKKK
jgi:hypothetical protein